MRCDYVESFDPCRQDVRLTRTGTGSVRYESDNTAHVDVVRPEHLAGQFPDTTRLMPVHNPGRLSFDHAEIIDRAVVYLRERYARSPDPDDLLGDEFTIRELRLAHEQIAGTALQRDWFRRTMEPQLIATGVLSSRGRGRPAELFRRA